MPERKTPRWGVIFDSDGIIVDTEEISLTAFIGTVEELFPGFKVSEEDILSNCGLTDRDICDYYQSRYDLKADLDHFVRVKQARYQQLAAQSEIRVFPGALELLAALDDAGAHCALASSGTWQKIRFNHERAGIWGRFKIMVSAEDFPNGKPDPALFLGAAELANLKPQNCVVVEDSMNGIIAAHAAGMRCVAVTNTFPAASLTTAADLVVDSLEELNPARLKALALGES